MGAPVADVLLVMVPLSIIFYGASKSRDNNVTSIADGEQHEIDFVPAAKKPSYESWCPGTTSRRETSQPSIDVRYNAK